MNKKIQSALNILGVRPFRQESCYSLNDAQRNLQGRTHYVDNDTLKGFRARVLNAHLSHDGLVYWIIESVGNKPFDGKANKRFAAFDVFGDVVSDREQWHTTSKAADKERKAFLESFNAEKHTESRLLERAKRDAENAQAVFNAILEA
jgi:hypothetical protein